MLFRTFQNRHRLPANSLRDPQAIGYAYIYMPPRHAGSHVSLRTEVDGRTSTDVVGYSTALTKSIPFLGSTVLVVLAVHQQG